MYEELFSRTSGQVEQMMAPARKMQGLMVDHFSRMTDFQMQRLQNYSEIGLNQLRTMQEVRNPEDFQAFVERQTEMLKSTSEKLSADFSEVAEMQRSLAEELQKLARESFDGAVAGTGKQPRQPTSQAKKSA